MLKLLMQKVRSLELNLSVFEGYLRELSRRQGGLMPQLDKELSRISLHVEKERKEMKELLEWKDSAVGYPVVDECLMVSPNSFI